MDFPRHVGPLQHAAVRGHSGWLLFRTFCKMSHLTTDFKWGPWLCPTTVANGRAGGVASLRSPAVSQLRSCFPFLSTFAKLQAFRLSFSVVSRCLGPTFKIFAKAAAVQDNEI